MSYIATEGNALTDAVLRRTTDGTLVADVTIRVDQQLRAVDGSYTMAGKPVDYEITVWGKPAEHFAAAAQRGARLVAAGELTDEQYTDASGASRSRHRITAEHHGVSTRFAAAASSPPNGR